jgi:hypothetical protein
MWISALERNSTVDTARAFFIAPVFPIKRAIAWCQAEEKKCVRYVKEE